MTKRFLKKIIPILSFLLFVTPKLVNAADCTVTSSHDSGSGTLRECIETTTSDGDTVTIPANRTVNLTGEIDIDKSLNIVGAGDGTSIVDGIGLAGTGRMFEIDETGNGVSVLFSGLTIQNADSDDDGGAIRNNGTAALKLINCLLTGNETITPNFGGGAIFNDEGAYLLIDNSTLSNNKAYDEGGAIHNYQGSVMITNNSVVDGNSTTETNGEGGGIYSYDGTVDVINSTISKNKAMNGGGIYSQEGTLRIDDSTVTENEMDNDGLGGGIYCHDDSLCIIKRTQFTKNKANADGALGGAIYNDEMSSLNCQYCTFEENSALSSQGSGGGIYNIEGSAECRNCTFEKNSATESGGAIFSDGGSFSLIESTVNNNEVTPVTTYGGGGGIFSMGDYYDLYIDRSTISNNKAMGDFGKGGGIYADSPGVLITHSTINNNFANLDGGGIYQDNANALEILNSTISDNRADENGGGIYKNADIMTLNNVTIANNTADDDGDGSGDGGGIYMDTNPNNEMDFNNTIIADNTDKGGQSDDCFSDYDGGSGSILNSGGNNLIGDLSGCEVQGDSSNDLNNVDPLLDPNGLENNGGPTQTIALLSNSPAIDAASVEFAEKTDQRGTTRPQGSAPDIGAFEAGPSADLSATSVTFPETELGVTSDPQVVTLTNNGTIALEINSITVTGLDTGDYAQTNDCGSSLAVGASCNISITFTPIVVGVRQASITVNTQASLQLIGLLGSGITISGDDDDDDDDNGGCSLNTTPVASGMDGGLVFVGLTLVGIYFIRRRVVLN